MAANSERILVVENDPDISDMIARQALQPLGYQVSVASDASSAIGIAARSPNDLIIANLNLPGLSGKDLLVALNSQGLTAPFIVIAEKGDEHNVIQAFRLGAADYLLWPARDAEIVAVVERVIKQIRERRARRELDEQLTLTNQELQRRVRDLTTIFSVGRAVLSTTDQRALFDKLVEAAVVVSEADMGWITVRDEKNKAYLLTSQRNLPENWAKKLNQPLDDGVSTLVAMSGETLEIHGEPLKQFKISSLGRAAALVPIKVQKEVIGLLNVLRKNEKPFERGEQTLLEAIADYASISMVNAQLFRALSQTSKKPEI
jgi:DNA-binding response OmpR family regulator